jgi:hypothetical protein
MRDRFDGEAIMNYQTIRDVVYEQPLVKRSVESAQNPLLQIYPDKSCAQGPHVDLCIRFLLTIKTQPN